MSAPVLVTRPFESAMPLVHALREAGCGADPCRRSPWSPTTRHRLSALRWPGSERPTGSWSRARMGPRWWPASWRDRGRPPQRGSRPSAIQPSGPSWGRGLPVRALAPEARPGALVAAMEAHGPLAGRHVLLARSDAAAHDLPEALVAAGATVRNVVAYRTVVGPASSRRPLVRTLADPSTRVVVFASGSAVRGAFLLAGPRASRLRELHAVTIGPSTSAAARHAGLTVAVEAGRPDVEHLVAAVLQVAARP